MSFFNIDVHTEIFTPQEYPVEILEAAKNHDVVCCCLPSASKQFLAFMLFKEFYHRSNGVSVFIQEDVVYDAQAADSNSANIILSNKILGIKQEENDCESKIKQIENDEDEREGDGEGAEEDGIKLRQCSLPFESLSNIHTIKLRSDSFDPDEIYKQITKSSVIICSKKSFLKLIKGIPSGLLDDLALIVVDNVHEALKSPTSQKEVKEILGWIRRNNHVKQGKNMKNAQSKTRVVCLTISLLQYYGNESDRFWRMERTFKNLQNLCGAPSDTSSNVTALLRYSVIPTERIIPYGSNMQSPEGQQLSLKIKTQLQNLRRFIVEHTYDPIALYGYGGLDPSEEKTSKEIVLVEGEEDDVDSLAEELKKIPNPKDEPLKIIQQIESILDEFGPWCADRALMLFTRDVEELRVHTPYERHYLLLGLLFTQLISIHVMCQETFSKCGMFKAMETFCTPKLQALIGILRRFDLSQPLEIRRKPTEHLTREDSTNTDENQQKQNVSNAEKTSGKSHKKKKYGKDGDKGKSKKHHKSKVKFAEDKEDSNETNSVNSTTPLPGEEEQEGQEENKEKSQVIIDDFENQLNSVIETEKVPNEKIIEEEVKTEMKGDISPIDDSSKIIILKNEEQDLDKSICSVVHEIPISNKTEEELDKSTVIHEITISNKTEEECEVHPVRTNTTTPSPTNILATTTTTTNTTTTVSTVKKHKNFPKRTRYSNKIDENALCGLLLTETRMDAKILYHFIKALAEADPKLQGLVPEIALPFSNIYGEDSDEAEREYKRRENSLRKFRYREANLLIGTTLLEEGIELPKANLVIRFDEPKSFRSYLFSKGRAQAFDGEYYVFSTTTQLTSCLRHLATFKLVEEMLLSHSIIPKPITARFSNEKEIEWDNLFPRFKSASLSNAISIVNRYCARLPSDTFTRLTPIWSMDITDPADDQDDEKNDSESERRFACTLRLPINSPVKWPVTGVPMSSEVLAKRAVALQTVVVLHNNGELDDSLMPVGKEGVSQEPDLCTGDESVEEEYGEFRPGSTKRRQYYDKQLAPELAHCLPQVGKPVYLYWLHMTLTCPLPEEQNTRGRRLHPPELALQSFGILSSKEMPPLPPFPIYTRCGEVQIKLARVEESFELTEERLEKISAFHHYTFTSVLRLDKYLTLFDPESAGNSYYVIALRAMGREKVAGMEEDGYLVNTTPIEQVEIDWEFMDLINGAKDKPQPSLRSNDERKQFEFAKELYEDAVVMPWYRNNDQPQYFYVAEICENLTPQSQFPGCEFKTFEEYYQRKYQIDIQNPKQPLLDVDHTSARLNFLTPRYVNRKGMALPTSSETTKKAKRENLEQKQILVPELCAIHPFSGSLWRQAVSLPCILYRISSLLLANNIRVLVASQIKGLGRTSLPNPFHWEPLSFGWTLSDVVGFKPSKLPGEKIEEEVVKPSNETISETTIITTTTTPPPPSAPNDSSEEKVAKENSDIEEKAKDKPDAEKENQKVESENLQEKENKEEDKVEDDNEPEKEKEEEELSGFEKAAKEAPGPGVTLAESILLNEKLGGKSVNEILSEEMKKCRQPQLEIGTWTNEMAQNPDSPDDFDFNEDEDELLDPNVALPSNLMMIDKNWTWGGRSRLFNHRVHRALYGSPTHWGDVWDQDAFAPVEDFDEPNVPDHDNESVMSDMSGSTESFLDEDNNLKVQFINAHTAETLDKRKLDSSFDHRQEDEMLLSEDMWWNIDEDEEVDDSVNSVTNYKNQDNYSNYNNFISLDREEALKSNFQARVDEKVTDLHDIVCWDILKVQPRSHSKQQSNTESTVSPNPHYETLFKVLTPLHPPQVYPESETYRKIHTNRNVDSIGTIEKTNMDSGNENNFSFDSQPSLEDHIGPSPCQILQALTMSNANDGVNLERLETIGDSFLKYAITSYLFCTFENIHEGKLSHLRSKQVSNVHLYRLGRKRGLGSVMVSAKFEPHDNWLPPGYHIPKDVDKALLQSKLPRKQFSQGQAKALKGTPQTQIEAALKTSSMKLDPEFIPYNLVTQQSIPDKSIADCVEALIGAYLTSTGPFGALLFMSWLGMRVLPSREITKTELQTMQNNGQKCSDKHKGLFYLEVPSIPDTVILFDELKPPKSPLLRYNRYCEQELTILLKGYEEFENSIGYVFQDKSYLLQAFTHASYSSNTLTDCYQRLEFLGDAILDYLITRHLYEDPRQHSPGSLTDLRSALVNNTIFASLAVKNNFHKYFRHCSPGLSEVLQKFVSFQEHHGHTLTQDYYLMDEEECEEAEDIEVPKALGDVFESVAGAIFLDSGMSLDAVWKVYFRIMKDEIEQFSQNVPKSPIRELLELEPETAKFGKPEKLWDGRRVRVSVEIIEVGVFRGIGRNYRIAKCTAAKCALRHLRKRKH